MRICGWWVQRVARAQVSVDGEIVGKIGRGYLVLVGAQTGDGESDARLCADKLAGLRVFEDEQGKMNLSVGEVGGEILLVSQFTLLGDARHGRPTQLHRGGAPRSGRARCCTACDPCSGSAACASRPAASARTCRSN